MATRTPTQTLQTYTARDYSRLRGLDGISDNQVENHLELYQGYVSNTNKLRQEARALLEAGETGPKYAEIKRRYGFEYCGMRLHEYYFDNLGGDGNLSDTALEETLHNNWGSVDSWKKDFVATAKMRGVGWSILYQDDLTGQLSNHWITLHEDGHPPGFRPILVCDVWEHAFVGDYKPTERAKYVDAFFQNIDWSVCAKRLIAAGR